MRHTIASMNHYESRRVRLLKRLEQIRAGMLCDDLEMCDLLFGRGGEYSASRVREEVERLCDFVDERQRAFFAFGACDDGASQRVEQAGGDWPEAVSGLWNRDELLSRDLRTLPPTLTRDEREIVYTFFYCVVHVCLCPALTSGTVGDAREVIAATAALAEEGAELPGVRTTGDGVSLSHEDLVFSEMFLSEWDGFGNDVFLGSGRNDVFWLLDALYVAVEGGHPSELDDPAMVEEVRQSERGIRLREEREDGRKISDDVARNDLLGVLAGVDLGEWAAMREVERYEVALKGIDSCDEAKLLAAIDDFAFGVFLSGWYGMPSEDEWAAMGHKGRIDFVRRELEQRLEELHDVEQNGSDEQRVTEWYLGELDSVRDQAQKWVRQTGCADELFRQYAKLRRLFFGGGLPQGAFGGFARMWGAPNVEGFSRLAEGALEMYLGEKGVSRIMNDDLFVRTFDYLDEAKYNLDTSLLNDLLRSARQNGQF